MTHENTGTAPLLSDLQTRIKKAIVDVFRAPARSIAGDGYMTGNHYQSIRLGNESINGFRSMREDVFAGIDFTGKSVLDLGSNFGELSRLARRRGAREVAGIEYDPLFVKIAKYINVYDDIEHVNFSVGDITKKEIFSKQHDIVLAFSVYKMLEKNIVDVAKSVDQFLILETHALTPGLLRRYIEKILPHFSYCCIYQGTEVGVSEKPSERRALMLFSMRGSRWEFSIRRTNEISPASPHLRKIDLTNSKFGPFLSFHKFAPEISDLIERERGDIFRMAELSLSTKLPWEMEAANENKFTPANGYYWLMFLRGFSEYARSKEIDANNSYICWLRLARAHGRFDPGLKLILNDE